MSLVKPGLLTLLCALLLGACGGGGGGGSTVAAEEGAASNPVSSPSETQTCGDNCFLTILDVETVISQAVAEAAARDLPATIAVVDRVGNVLGVFAMDGASDSVTITSTNDIGSPITGGLENLNFIPAKMAAISKAITGAYLSTQGNAFTTRTASQIIQENFNPGEGNVPSGPLFGVQFSQLACSDFSQRNQGGASSVGPHRAPLGLSADPGGLPLYIDGVAVGGVGIVADGIYGLDKVITNFDTDFDELIATAATRGYAAPLDIRADQITIVGKTARFSDSFVDELQSSLADVQPLSAVIAANGGDYLRVLGYFERDRARAGTAFGQPGSGIRPADASVFVDAQGASLDAFVFVDDGNINRYPASPATDAPSGDTANALTANEVQIILNEAINLANESRAQIRVPVGTQARVTVSVVDTSGEILGMGRTRDGPVFGADVSLQKARTATFFSGTGRNDSGAPADILRGFPDTLYINSDLALLDTPRPSFSRYVLDAQLFLGNADALESTGTSVAFSDRAGGNLSRPHYPDGPTTGPPGPFSKPEGQWSVFSVGLQLDLVYNSLIQHVAFVAGLVDDDVEQNCVGNTGLAQAPDVAFEIVGQVPNLANGIQIFPGSVPIYRGDVLVGGIGVSGDGVDQDDMISFLGLHRAGLRLGTGIRNAPPEIRADNIVIPGQSSRLRYVNCPQTPFIDNNDTEVCNGI
ncbi:MAG: heme-binding protein [Pseudomonadales bacterium]|nr:heme-binding protein [Pseudomonadales bacterium]MDG1444319.1 heme-binding protein [Pseudomonadales bacterium]